MNLEIQGLIVITLQGSFVLFGYFVYVRVYIHIYIYFSRRRERLESRSNLVKLNGTVA